MVKLFALIAVAMVMFLGALAPVAAAADGSAAHESVLVSVNGSAKVAAGEHVDTLIVISGTSQVEGDVGTIVVVSGTATLVGATVHDLYVIDGVGELQAGTVVSGDVRTFRGTVDRQDGALVQGGVASLDLGLTTLGILVAGLALILFLGFAFAVLAFALLLAGLAGRQVRAVESIISREPGRALVYGLIAGIGLPLLAVALFVTVIGAPIAVALVILMPPLTFLAWIVAAMWVGEWIIGRLSSTEHERPYRAAVVGVIALAVAGLIPFVGAIATFFGLGALLLAGWRGLRRGPAVTTPVLDAPAQA